MARNPKLRAASKPKRANSSTSPAISTFFSLESTEENEAVVTASFTQQLYTLTYCGLTLNIFIYIFFLAYRIRLHSIDEYGFVIHEFDPYFNLRATEYMWEHGWDKFRTWFDYKVWYPLGRPVGTTTYPGIQMTACFIKWVLRGPSLNSICCLIPAWFGCLATLFTGLLGFECSLYSVKGSLASATPFFGSYIDYFLDWLNGTDEEEDELEEERLSNWSLDPLSPSIEVGVFSAGFMAVVPAHLMRSVGGGFDNESVAITAMCMTFWLWCRALRSGQNEEKDGMVFGILSGLSYFYMASLWGGYVFVSNLLSVHAIVLVLCGRFGVKLYRAYTFFYIVGTSLAIQVPVVGLGPLKSIEQMLPLLVFLIIQVLGLHRNFCYTYQLTQSQARLLHLLLFATSFLVLLLLIHLVLPVGYFGPMSSRVRGLFIPHIRTGNPLVDSVAEHQPASVDAYFQYLHFLCFLQPVALVQVTFFYLNDSSSFLLVYFLAAYFFSHKMVRLILLTAPIASVMGGIVMGRLLTWTISSVIPLKPTMADLMEDLDEAPPPIAVPVTTVPVEAVHDPEEICRHPSVTITNVIPSKTHKQKKAKSNNPQIHHLKRVSSSGKFNHVLKILKIVVSVTVV